jgi:glutathione S-transferase
MSLTLYYHPLASYCHKVLIALYEHDIVFEPRLIDLGAAADRAELQAVWPMVKFPVLRDQARGRDLAESSTIIEYLDHHAAEPGRLIPAAWDDALDVRMWDRVFDGYVMTPMQEIVANTFRPVQADMDGQRAALDTAYRMIDGRMASRTWVAGAGFSMADCAAAPSLFYAATVQPFPQECMHLAAYAARLMARPSVQRVLAEARPYFGMYPFADRIPANLR